MEAWFMAKKNVGDPKEYRLPKDALLKIALGQPHAENDRIRRAILLPVRD